MKTLTDSNRVQLKQGFKVYVLNNGKVELAVVPELGAKIVSLKNLATDREWLWHPTSELRLFKNQPGDEFSQSPLTGVDECLPTVAPCIWQERSLPDHGEVWNAVWQLSAEDWENGRLKTSVYLQTLPLQFTRTIELTDDEICFRYQLHNLGSQPEPFLWTIHPLLRLQAGDRLVLPDSTRAVLPGVAWVNDVTSAALPNECAKKFATPISEGRAGIVNDATGDRLEFIWNPRENNTLGLWLTRGGWHGHHHFAIEPTNGADDSLAAAARQNHCGIVPPDDSMTWQLRLRLGVD
jgi:galactose mutarotase-like enzyme